MYESEDFFGGADDRGNGGRPTSVIRSPWCSWGGQYLCLSSFIPVGTRYTKSLSAWEKSMVWTSAWMTSALACAGDGEAEDTADGADDADEDDESARSMR